MKVSNKKKIFCIIGQLRNGGTEKQLFLFLKNLNRMEFDPIVIVNGTAEGIWKSEIEKLEIQILSLKTPFTPLFKFVKFKYLLIKHNPDIIFAWSFFTNIYHLVSGKIPFIGSLRQQLSIEKKILNSIHLKYCISGIPLIVNSNYVASELIEEGVPKKNISVIHNIFEPYTGARNSVTELRKQYNIPNESIVILGVGRDSPSKDWGFFIDVIEEASKKSPKIQGCLIGSGGMAWKNEIDKRGLNSKITAIGEIKDCRKIMHIGDIFFLSSKAEGLPNVVLEAIDAKCAILATDVGGISDIIKNLSSDLKTDILIRKRNVDTATGQLLKLTGNKQLRENVSEQLFQRLSEFECTKIIQQYAGLLKSKLKPSR